MIYFSLSSFRFAPVLKTTLGQLSGCEPEEKNSGLTYSQEQQRQPASTSSQERHRKSAMSAKHLVFDKSEMWSETIHVTHEKPLYFSFRRYNSPSAFVAVVLSTSLPSSTVRCSVSGSSRRFHARPYQQPFFQEALIPIFGEWY